MLVLFGLMYIFLHIITYAFIYTHTYAQEAVRGARLRDSFVEAVPHRMVDQHEMEQ